MPGSKTGNRTQTNREGTPVKTHNTSLTDGKTPMKMTALALALLVGLGAGCTTMPLASLFSSSDLPDCFDSNYDQERRLFTMRNVAANQANQQCLLTVWPSGEFTSASRLTEGSYVVQLANGGGGGAGGTLQPAQGGGGGGGGGAGAMETETTVVLTEGQYKLTLGAGGPGGNACLRRDNVGGGPGWAGSPTSMVRVATGEVVVGPAGADTYARPTRAQNERLAGNKRDGHGGSGPGQSSGDAAEAKPPLKGAPAFVAGNPIRPGGGGDGGDTSRGEGGEGGGGGLKVEANAAVERGSLGSGGGGGMGTPFVCEAGGTGGNGFIAVRRI
jgi:hypothetical protein